MLIDQRTKYIGITTFDQDGLSLSELFVEPTSVEHTEDIEDMFGPIGDVHRMPVGWELCINYANGVVGPSVIKAGIEGLRTHKIPVTVHTEINEDDIVQEHIGCGDPGCCDVDLLEYEGRTIYEDDIIRKNGKTYIKKIV